MNKKAIIKSIAYWGFFVFTLVLSRALGDWFTDRAQKDQLHDIRVCNEGCRPNAYMKAQRINGKLVCDCYSHLEKEVPWRTDKL
jgi:hypothetical protein